MPPMHWQLLSPMQICQLIIERVNMTVEFFGIPNCDTVKKARKWLDAAAQRCVQIGDVLVDHEEITRAKMRTQCNRIVVDKLDRVGAPIGADGEFFRHS